MASQLYYYWLCVAALSIGIFNFSTYSGGKELQCITNSNFLYDEYVAYNKTKNITTTIPRPLNPNEVYTVEQSSSNILSLLQMVIAFAYLSILGVTIILALIVSCLSNQLPEDYMKFGKCKRCLAMLCKILPPFIVIVHWIILFVIIGLWIMVLTDTCLITRINISGEKAYFQQSNICLIVTSAIWVVLHCFGSVLKDLSYVEPFMYSPRIEGSSPFFHVMLKTLGP
jgi:hypothetical protein